MIVEQVKENKKVALIFFYHLIYPAVLGSMIYQVGYDAIPLISDSSANDIRVSGQRYLLQWLILLIYVADWFYVSVLKPLSPLVDSGKFSAVWLGVLDLASAIGFLAAFSFAAHANQYVEGNLWLVVPFWIILSIMVVYLFVQIAAVEKNGVRENWNEIVFLAVPISGMIICILTGAINNYGAVVLSLLLTLACYGKVDWDRFHSSDKIRFP